MNETKKEGLWVGSKEITKGFDIMNDQKPLQIINEKNTIF